MIDCVSVAISTVFILVLYACRCLMNSGNSRIFFRLCDVKVHPRGYTIVLTLVSPYNSYNMQYRLLSFFIFGGSKLKNVKLIISLLISQPKDVL